MVPTKYVQVRGERQPDGLPLVAVGSGFGGYGKSGAGAPLQSLTLHEVSAEGLGDQAAQVKTQFLVSLELERGLAIVAIGEKGIVRQDQRVALGGWGRLLVGRFHIEGCLPLSLRIAGADIAGKISRLYAVRRRIAVAEAHLSIQAVVPRVADRDPPQIGDIGDRHLDRSRRLAGLFAHQPYRSGARCGLRGRTV